MIVLPRQDIVRVCIEGNLLKGGFTTSIETFDDDVRLVESPVRSPLYTGETRPAMFVGGFSETPRFHRSILSCLQMNGYDAISVCRPWNIGKISSMIQIAKTELDRLSDRTGQPVDLIGHSLGGAIALFLAYECPGQVRSVQTMCSPLARFDKVTLQWPVLKKVFEWSVTDMAFESARLSECLCGGAPEGIPVSILTSPEDEVVPVASSKPGWNAAQGWWEYLTINRPDTAAWTHMSMPFNTAAWLVMLDRLAQDVSKWEMFKAENYTEWAEYFLGAYAEETDSDYGDEAYDDLSPAAA